MKTKSRYSEHSDVSEKLLTPTDVKQYVFCPRVTYFSRVMRIRPIMGAQQEAAQKSHEKLSDMEKRRKSVLRSGFPIPVRSKQFDVNLVSNRLHVHGRLDMLLLTMDREYIPVEFKDMKSKRRGVHLDHKYQLVTLALLVEDAFQVVVKRGLLYYFPDDKAVFVPITQNMKTRAKKYLQGILRMIESEEPPDPRAECRRIRVGCGYADQCVDF